MDESYRWNWRLRSWPWPAKFWQTIHLSTPTPSSTSHTEKLKNNHLSSSPESCGLFPSYVEGIQINSTRRAKGDGKVRHEIPHRRTKIQTWQLLLFIEFVYGASLEPINDSTCSERHLWIMPLRFFPRWPLTKGYNLDSKTLTTKMPSGSYHCVPRSPQEPDLANKEGNLHKKERQLAKQLSSSQ